MFGLVSASSASEATAKLESLNKSQAIIEFDLDGNILAANENFLKVMGYTLAEIQGRHHSMFVEPAHRESGEYKQFWEKLKHGEYQAAQFKRIGKDGREVWIDASYNPIRDRKGRPFKVVKYATDITRQKAEYADLLGQVNAIKTSLAVVEFDLEGRVLTANDKFLTALGYTLAEIQGQHHGMFVGAADRASSEYKAFWDRLRRGEYQAGQFKRSGKGGREVWIEASYSPILDLNGKPFKVVKYATDITSQVTLLANLRTLIGEIEGAIENSTAQVELATGAVRETSASVQTMAASTEELAASVREIADNMARSRNATDNAFAQTTAADDATQQLAATSKAMGGIVDMIRNIAGQINLLALNATIESARAGEAGKGFAVVASEVKNLAQQASHATDQISKEIGELQTVSNGVVSALSNVAKSIGEVREYITGTASSAEEQSVVTQEMSFRMQNTALSVVSINDNMARITTAVGQVASAMNATKEAAQVLAR